MTLARRSQSIVTVSLLIAMTALAGCKGGDGGGASSTNTASAPATTPTTNPTTDGNHAPTITGSAPTAATTNVAYTFAPSAADADGDSMTFQIQNKPSWATFNTVSGQLSGTPTQAHAGTYANVVITASDGKSSASLPAFSITVSAAPVAGSTGAATLSWMPPTENTDGTALTDLAGFVIVYGPSSTTLTQSVRIENPSVSSYVFQDLPAGTHYFGIKAYAQSGAESEVSSTVSKTIG